MTNNSPIVERRGGERRFFTTPVPIAQIKENFPSGDAEISHELFDWAAMTEPIVNTLKRDRTQLPPHGYWRNANKPIEMIWQEAKSHGPFTSVILFETESKFPIISYQIYMPPSVPSVVCINCDEEHRECLLCDCEGPGADELHYLCGDKIITIVEHENADGEKFEVFLSVDDALYYDLPQQLDNAQYDVPIYEIKNEHHRNLLMDIFKMLPRIGEPNWHNFGVIIRASDLLSSIPVVEFQKRSHRHFHVRLL